MKLCKISHYRCDEIDWDATSYVMAPDSMTDDEFEAAVYRAQEAYLAYIEEWYKTNYVSPPSYSPDYKKYPDKTVAEVNAIHAAEKAAYDEYNKKENNAKRSFKDYLYAEGFNYLWEDGSATFELTISWGHNHGKNLDYALPIPSDRVTAIIPRSDDDF